MGETNNNKIKTTTKKIVWTLIICAVVWISLSYIMAFISLFMYGETEPLSDLSQQVCITVVGSVIGYFAKSLIENHSKANNDLEYYKLNNGHGDDEVNNGDSDFEEVNIDEEG